jgi:hypothetical protein
MRKLVLNYASFELCPCMKRDRTDKKLKYSYVDFKNEKLKKIIICMHKVRGANTDM